MSEQQRRLTSLPAMLRGGDYNPDQWLDRPDILEEDIRLMHEAGVNTATLGVFSWTAYERADGEYDFAWLSGGDLHRTGDPIRRKTHLAGKSQSRDPPRTGGRPAG